MLKADRHGVSAGFFRHDRWEKFSTFFPKNWSRVKVVQKIEEAFKNPIEKFGDSFIGQTAEGIKIKIVLCIDKSELRILSAFPLYDQNKRGVKNLITQLGKKEICYIAENTLKGSL